MPFIAVPLDLPPDVVELRAGDVDGDGVSDLVAVERKRRGSDPDSMALSAYSLNAEGRVADRWRVDLKATPLVLDIESGVWAISQGGLSRVTRDGVSVVASASSPLAGFGATTPVFADVFVDIDDDGTPEGVLASGGKVRLMSVDGKERLAVRASGRGELDVRTRGGTQLVSSEVSPYWHVDDINGDGIQDLLLSKGKRLTVYPITSDGVGSRYTVELPINVNPRRREGTRKKGETRKDVVSVWLRDFDADGRTDFAAQLWVTEGSWMGAEGEVVYAKGTGQGFGPLQRMRTENAVLLVRTLDLDGDGDTEIATAEVDFGVGNLTRAMLTQKIRVDINYREMRDGRYQATKELHSVVVPVGNDRDPPVVMEHDLTGDGVPDLVTSQDSERVELFAGTGKGFADEPTASLNVGFEQGEHKLWVGNILGDERSEIVVWKLRTRQAKVLILQP